MHADAQVGVCYGGLGNNLPSDQEVVNLYKSNGIRRMRSYYPVPQALQALRGSNIELILDVPNSNLERLANDAPAAAKWVQDNVLNYYPDVKFRIISVGNEVNPNGGETARLAPFVLLAMSKIYGAIASAGLKDQIKDGQFQYKNLFDAMLDNAYSAVEKAGGPNVKIVVSESGWPSAGGPAASVENAATYYRNLINHVERGSGSPKRPGKAIETYLFAIFDEIRRLETRVRNILGSSYPPSSPNTSFLSTN
ncbi:hypothetical protein RHGRI_002040 [Rhododendron griersonianum]|uniref:Glucan endo-1,3-beta-D-glucosidase n=1 Tax=Rhododendron griersonianum TaxID=479676 RepID=A0AAV6LMW2_9ERIC|nr:hypothetical protein RHGRI_002040 [Rhododendron griersonianum]